MLGVGWARISTAASGAVGDGISIAHRRPGQRRAGHPIDAAVVMLIAARGLEVVVDQADGLALYLPSLSAFLCDTYLFTGRLDQAQPGIVGGSLRVAAWQVWDGLLALKVSIHVLPCLVGPRRIVRGALDTHCVRVFDFAKVPELALWYE